MREERVGDQADGTDGALDGVEQRQTGENPHGELSFSLAVSVLQDGMSLDTGTFSRQPEVAREGGPRPRVLLVCTRFQLIAEARSISFRPSDTP